MNKDINIVNSDTDNELSLCIYPYDDSNPLSKCPSRNNNTNKLHGWQIEFSEQEGYKEIRTFTCKYCSTQIVRKLKDPKGVVYTYRASE